MGTTIRFDPATLFMGLLYPVDASKTAEEAWDRLTLKWGPEAYRSPEIPFRWSDYYNKEMGAPILRSLRSFRDPVDPALLAEIKTYTNEIEREFSIEGRRRVNFDPGLLFLSRLILATTKDRSHRLPLKDGIYGELTLMYEGGGWKALPWTYPDYRTQEYASALTEMRILHKARSKQEE